MAVFLGAGERSVSGSNDSLLSRNCSLLLARVLPEGLRKSPLPPTHDLGTLVSEVYLEGESFPRRLEARTEYDLGLGTVVLKYAWKSSDLQAPSYSLRVIPSSQRESFFNIDLNFPLHPEERRLMNLHLLEQVFDHLHSRFGRGYSFRLRLRGYDVLEVLKDTFENGLGEMYWLRDFPRLIESQDELPANFRSLEARVKDSALWFPGVRPDDFAGLLRTLVENPSFKAGLENGLRSTSWDPLVGQLIFWDKRPQILVISVTAARAPKDSDAADDSDIHGVLFSLFVDFEPASYEDMPL
ncbi:MAG: hypothetical protein EA369_09255 [Bradymonadales bacterium]|nr:MAG: hypothetical protein EA369_09255 [Bradymonadales bacterium]